MSRSSTRKSAVKQSGQAGEEPAGEVTDTGPATRRASREAYSDCSRERLHTARIHVQARADAASSTGQSQPKGPGDHSEVPSSEHLKQADVNPAEQGQTANIRQNTTNKGVFQGRRIK